MSHGTNTVELFLIAMLIIFSVPYLIWRGLRTEYYAPLVVVQIICGILLGPGVLGAMFPDREILTLDVPGESRRVLPVWASRGRRSTRI